MSTYGKKSSFSAEHMRPHACASATPAGPTLIIAFFISEDSSASPRPSRYITSSTSRASSRYCGTSAAAPTHVMHSSAVDRSDDRSALSPAAARV